MKLRSIQKVLFICAVASLALSIANAYYFHGIPIFNVDSDILKALFRNISNSIWQIPGMPFILNLQFVSVMCFFLIAVYKGLKILRAPLSEQDKRQVLMSPYEVFNRLIFSRTLLGKTYGHSSLVFDARGLNPKTVADVYLIHFQISNKKYFLPFIFIFAFIVPHFIRVIPESPFSQLVINFVFLNLYFIFLYDLILFTSSAALTKGKNNG